MNVSLMFILAVIFNLKLDYSEESKKAKQNNKAQAQRDALKQFENDSKEISLSNDR